MRRIYKERWFVLFSFAAFAVLLSKGLKRADKVGGENEYMRLCAAACFTAALFAVVPSAVILTVMHLTEQYFSWFANMLDTVGMVCVYIAGIACAEKIKKRIDLGM